MNTSTDDDARTKAGAGKALRLGRLYCDDPTTEVDAQRRDEEREAKIDVLRLQFLSATNPEERRVIWRDFKSEIASRSPAQVRRMEIVRGLLREHQR